MNFNKVEFETSSGNASQLPESTKPEIVFSGHSNVGKSSLINKLVQRKNLARVSSQPGKTATINFYNAEEFTEWAHAIGPKTTETVQYFLTSGKEAEQGFKACASLTKLGNRYGAERLEDACERVLRLTSAPTLRNISTLCKSSSAYREADEPVARKTGGHGITRGAAYYSKGGQRHE